MFHKKILAKRARMKSERSYYAAITKNIEPVNTRIVETGNEVRLQIYEPYKHKWFYTYYDPTFLIEKLLKKVQFFERVYSWDTKLAIASPGRQERREYLPEKVIQYHPETIISNEFVKLCESRRTYYWMIAGFQEKCMPDLLYAIPQETWNSFIEKLPRQDIVKALNLGEHRHLWDAYNYAASSKHASHLRADALGKYHFLTSLVAKQNKYYPDGFHDRGWFWKSDIVEPEREGSYGMLPSFEAQQHYVYPMDINYRKVLGDIDAGKSPAEILTYRLPYLTPLFLNKFSHCPLWSDVRSVGLNFILPRVTSEGKTDNQKLNEFIAALPSSKKNPLSFSYMINDSRKLNSKELGSTVASNFFYSTRNNSGFFNNFSNNHFTDYMDAIFADLVFPGLVRSLQHLTDKEKLSMGNPDKILSPSYNLYHLVKRLRREMSNILPESVKPIALISLEEKWHRNINVINASKPQPIYGYEWHVLFQDQMINGVMFSCLAKESQLRQEGKEMGHCVGGYARRCMYDNAHIIKVSASSGERSTIELYADNHDKNIRIAQHYGKNNSTPCNEITHATAELMDRLKSRKIRLNSSRGIVANKIPDDRLVAHQWYPYSFYDKEVQEKIYQAWKDAKVLPPFFMADNYDAMLRKSRAVEMILEKLPEILDEIDQAYLQKKIKLI